MSVERFGPNYDYFGYVFMERQDTGGFVRFEDYSKIEKELSELRKQQAEAAANSATVCNVFYAFGEHYDDSLSPAENVRRLIQQQAANVSKPNDKHVFVFPDASMTKIRYIFVDGEMVYENLEPEQ